MSLHVHRYGEGRPVLALHGIKGHGARWRCLAEEHLAGWRVVAPDLRGHGRSTYDAPWHVERHVADLLALLDAEGVDRADVVGHSYGGMIAVHLARVAPTRVGRLVLLDPAIGLDPARMRERAHESLATASYADPGEALAARAVGWPDAPAQAVDDEVAEHLERGPDGRWRWRFEPAAVVTAFSEMARPAVAPPPGVPTHLVIAVRAGLVRPEFVAACREALDGAFTVTEIDAGHMLFIDRPAQVGPLVRDLLSR
ncbi:alpha/beta fold hydrolase [Actinomadura miaoliensis]|uniref:Lipase LipV n=1 Tax=Actinomadura miaoliensis TaxID=430685 RepID=A0ABP7VUW6_9ACTN